MYLHITKPPTLILSGGGRVLNFYFSVSVYSGGTMYFSPK